MNYPQEHTDQMGRTIRLERRPLRIISLVPSQTELLFDLGLDEQVIAITKFCIHPAEKFKSTRKIGGTKKLDLALIRELQPDLIIGNKEENEESQILELMRSFPVWMSDIHNLEEALDMIRKLGALIAEPGPAERMATRIAENFAGLSAEPPAGKPSTVAYFIWKDPYMVAGKNTFIDAMLGCCGLINVFAESRYPQVSPEQLCEANPAHIFLSSEPYPFNEKHMAFFRDLCPEASVKIVDGELFSWYGSRLQHSPAYFKGIMQKK